MDRTPGEIRVLHVDDDAAFADMSATFLEREGDRISVDVATTVDEALAALEGDDVDCVVSDYDMPGRNGIEFLEAVRETHPDLPFVLFTGKGSEEVAGDAISAGATDYLQKGGGTEQYELLANRIRNAVEQYRTRRRATELDRIRTLASDVNQALVRAASRSEVVSRVCEILADSDPYLFAWVGEVEDDRVVPRDSAGIEEGYLDDVTITVDDSPTGRGPAGTAVREGRVAVSQSVVDDPAFEPWRDDALERGYRATAAVPLEYDGTLYGVLAVYADRPDAFDATERDLLAELGDDVAHALNSLEVRDRLRRERDRRQALFENAPGPVVSGTISDDGDSFPITAVNDAFEDVFGYDPAEAVGRDVADLIVPEPDAERHTDFRERTAAGATTVETVERVTADGPREFLLTIIPYGIDTTPADGWYAWYTDVSQRRARERAIEELHRTADALMAAETVDAIAEVAVDAAMEVLDMPANALHRYDEASGRLEPVAWTDRVEALVREIPSFEPGEGLAWTAFETGEVQVYDDVSTAPERLVEDTRIRSEIIVPLGDVGVLLASSDAVDAFDETDVSLARTLATHVTTAIKRTEREAELTRRQSLLEAVLEASIDGILVIDENREYVTWNQQFVDMWGVPEELVGGEHEEAGLEWALDVLEDPDEFIAKVEYLYAHPHEESRDQVRLTDGRVFDRYSAPVQADDGTYFGRVWFFRDITERERHEAELARQNEQLEEFVSIVSHDLRNPLGVVQGRLELAREECDSDHLDSAADAVERSFALIDDLLTLAREGNRVSDVGPVALADAVRDCWNTVETSDATLVVETDRTIRADAGRLKQLFENLIRNAVEHGSTGSRTAADDTVENAHAGVTVTVGDLDGGFYVADDGPGIPEAERKRVFDAGYSTSERGTGFGLSIVREVVDAHGWQIRVHESEAGGARFEVTDVEFA